MELKADFGSTRLVLKIQSGQKRSDSKPRATVLAGDQLVASPGSHTPTDLINTVIGLFA
jgi:hypothetical protein